MKLTNSKLIEIINEAVMDDDRVASILSKILDVQVDALEKLEDLDVSMDYVAASLIGADPLGIQLTQKTMGRKTPVRGIKNGIE